MGSIRCRAPQAAASPRRIGATTQSGRRRTARSRSLSVRFGFVIFAFLLTGGLLRLLAGAVELKRQAHEIARVGKVFERCDPRLLPAPGVAAGEPRDGAEVPAEPGGAGRGLQDAGLGNEHRLRAGRVGAALQVILQVVITGEAAVQ